MAKAVVVLLALFLSLSLHALAHGHVMAPSPAPTPAAHHHHAPSHGHHHGHPPTHSPAVSPVYHFPRSFVAVQGVVYCESCKYSGSHTFLDASPLLGAGVKLVCNNTKYRPVVVRGKTDKNGYFYMEAPNNITSYAAHTCKASLVSSPSPSCSKPSVFGGALRPVKHFLAQKNLPFVLYSVGPFTFRPNCNPN